MKKILMIVALALALVLAGCTQQSPPGGVPQQGSAKFQSCVSQCGVGNAGNGTLCQDGCRMQEAADTKSVMMCNELTDQANQASCYGTVAKASSNISVCDAFSNTTQKDYCLSVAGSTSTN